MQYIVVGVKFPNGNKTYYFSPKNQEYKEKDYVIVDTAKGQEYAQIEIANKEVDESEVILPLREVVRLATDKDKKQYEENLRKSQEARPIVEELIKKYELEMKIVDIEYAFDNSKITISFISDNRVDFRDLVKELASKLKNRIELRQIGIRDQAKVIGGIGLCGRICCCKTFLNDFEKVSIKMAKNQGLSLNPTQISGLCGRLLCCLEYENPYYAEVISKMPKLNSVVKTKDGEGTVIYQNILKQMVTVKIVDNDNTTIKDYPLNEIHFEKAKQDAKS